MNKEDCIHDMHMEEAVIHIKNVILMVRDDYVLYQ